MYVEIELLKVPANPDEYTEGFELKISAYQIAKTRPTSESSSCPSHPSDSDVSRNGRK